MRNRRAPFIRGFLILFIALSPLVFSQDQIELKTSFHQDSVILAEPIYYTFHFTNKSDELVEFRSRMDPQNDLRLRVVVPKRAPKDYIGVPTPGFTPYLVFKIPPGETYSYTMTIYYDEDSATGLLVNQPGEIKAAGVLEGFAGRDQAIFRLPPKSVNVRKPSEKDMESLKVIGSKSMIKDIHEARIHPQNRAAAEEFINDFPQSSYRKYVLYALAGGYASTKRGYDPDFSRAAELYKKYIEEYPDALFADNAVIKIAELYDRMEDEEKARRWAIRLYNNYPDSDVNNPSNEMLQKYIFSRKPGKAPWGLWMLYERTPSEDRPEMEELRRKLLMDK